jgi:hypothetical protein
MTGTSKLQYQHIITGYHRCDKSVARDRTCIMGYFLPTMFFDGR